jgi:dihydrofolate reductase
MTHPTRKLVLKMSVSLDAFVAGPNGELDWLFRTSSAESAAWTVALISQAGLHIMGSRTFGDMAAYWPTSKEPFAAPMNEIPKVVFSRSGSARTGTPSTTRALVDARAHAGAPSPSAAPAVESWNGARVATGDLAEEVARLKAEPGKDIVAHGGAAFAQSLVRLGLVDEYRLLVHPVALGRGLPLFSGLGAPIDLELVEVKPFAGGVVAHTYRKR